ncbi:preprotein translocase subunit SecY [Candidatus Saccharibacteria bacterium]|nr:preprotein translocase subunit SecY [Candidatus Saccharibacteria bacterium]
MQKRLLIVLGIIVVYRFLSHVPVPLAEPTQLREVITTILNSSSFGGFLNLLSGGALASVSIMLVGLSPYITASIVMQLLTKAIPRMEELHKDGESGRRRINQWTRLLTLPLAVIQSIAFIFILRQQQLAANTAVDITANATPLQWVLMVGALTAGAMLLMWLGELITEQGIGNGMSLLIFAGIISQLPSTVQLIINSITNVSSDAEKLNLFGYVLPINAFSLWLMLGLALVGLIVLYFIVKINEAQRIVTINYAKRVQGNRAYGGVQSILPVKLITAGVVPVIFAVAFLALPTFVGQFLSASNDPGQKQLGEQLIQWFQTPNLGLLVTTGDLGALIYPAIYFVLVVLFTYFYTNIVFNSSEIAENLQKQGGFLADVRPGLQTEKHLSRMVNRLTLFGAFALGIISILPFVTEYVLAHFNISAQNLAIGGTGLLIAVSVTLETLRQINSRALMVTYDQDY